MTVMGPVPFMEKGITTLLMKRNSPLTGNVAMSSLRYGTNSCLVFVIRQK